MAKSVAEQYDLYSDLARGDSEEETVGETREHNDELRKVKANLLRENLKLLKRLARIADVNSKLRLKNLELEKIVCGLFKTAILVRSSFWRHLELHSRKIF